MSHIRFHVLSVRIAAILLSLNLYGCAELPPQYDYAHDSILFSQEAVRAKGDSSPDDEVVALRITAEENLSTGPSFSWLHNGQLFVRRVNPKDKNGKIITEYAWCWRDEFLYCGKEDQLVVVSTLRAFSAMMREELDTPQSTDSFLKLWLPETFNLFLGYREAYVIDQRFLKYWASKSPLEWGDASEAQLKQSSEIVKKYVYDGPTIENGKWRTVFYVSVLDGSVEKWELNGQVQPFSVDHLTKTVVEKAGTIAQFSRWL